MKCVGYIYLLTNLVNGKKYVGQTISKPERRWTAHIADALHGRKHGPLHCAIRKHGPDQFSAEVIHTCTLPTLNRHERRFIKLHNTFIDDGQGYNLTTGGNSDCVKSERTRQLQSSSMKNQWAKPEFRARQAAAKTAENTARQPLSKAQKLKVSLAQKKRLRNPVEYAKHLAGIEKRWSSETERERQSVRSKEAWARRGQGNRGHSDETKKRLSEASKRWFAEHPEGRLHLAQVNKLRMTDMDLRRRMSAAATKQWSDPEARRKMSEIKLKGRAA